MSKKRPRQGGRSWITNVFDSLIVVFLRDRLNKTHDRLCRLICSDRLFNSDLSLELDRLQVENDRLQSLFKKQGGEL